MEPLAGTVASERQRTGVWRVCAAAAGALDRVTTRSALSEDETSLDAQRSIATMLRAIMTIGLSKVESPGTDGVRCGRATFSGQYLSILQGYCSCR
jgi:hypothetical protein